MRPTKPQFFIASVFLASVMASSAQVALNISTSRTYRQTPVTLDFRKPGSFKVQLDDGSFSVTACADNGSAVPFGIDAQKLCLLGTTAYIIAGDVGGAFDDEGNPIPDGLPDNQKYYELAAVQPASGIAWGFPGKCSLYSRPPSTLPSNLAGFAEGTIRLFFDYRDFSNLSEYALTNYVLERKYQSRFDMDHELVPGLYIWNFPFLPAPEGAPARISVQLYPIPEGYQEVYNVRSGFRFTRLNSQPIKWNPDGFIEMDPRIPNTIEWTGNLQGVVYPTDSLYIEMTSFATATGSPNREGEGVQGDIFPAKIDMDGVLVPAKVRLPSAITHKYIFPPAIMGKRYVPPRTYADRVFPYEALLKINLVRSLGSTAIATDGSSRVYELPVRFVDTYEGWAYVNFKQGTSAADRLPTANPDGDPYTNLQEWQNKTDPLKPNPARPMLSFVPSRSTTRPTLGANAAQGTTASGVTGFYEIRHPQPATSPATEVVPEFSSDMVNWSPITDDNADWQVIRETQEEVVDRDPDVIVRSRRSELGGNGFIRMRVTLTAAPPATPTSIPESD